MAKCAEPRWASVTGDPEDPSVGEPLPSTGRCDRSCRAAARAFRLRRLTPRQACGHPRSAMSLLAPRHGLQTGGGSAPPDARALPRTCFGSLLPLRGCDLGRSREQPGPDRSMTREASGRSCKTWGHVCSLNLGGTFTSNPFPPKYRSHRNRIALNPRTWLREQLFSTVMFCVPYTRYLHIILKIKEFGGFVLTNYTFNEVQKSGNTVSLL